MKNHMDYDYSEISQRVQNWAQQAYQSGWISEPDSTLFQQTNKPALFETVTRPLIVAFMGGTGVGKSALLNRLAGKAIAKSGVARPTSKEVTLFHHQSVTLQNLPLTDICLANHEDEQQKNVVWIDMPDFDSTNAHNKELVLSWLAHIDVLIYVVSPERYRDEKAWRLLLSEGKKHAWLFVMNQWDRGESTQFLDFEKQLHVVGFTAPLIFKTCCAENLENDEFENLKQTLTSLATQKTISQLAQRGTQIRTQTLQTQLQSYTQQFGSETALKKLHAHWQHSWKTTQAQLQQSFAWRLQALAAHFAQLAMLEKSGELNLWDDFAQTYFEDALNALIIDAQNLHLPTAPLESQLLDLRSKAKKQFNTQVELQTRHALAQRGNAWQRGLLKMVAIAEILLPLTAMSWVGFQVVNGYYESNHTHEHYLNLDFAIHSTLLCSLSWLVPFFILKKCQPSLEKCALRGLQKGISNGLENLNNAVELTLVQFNQQRTQKLTQLHSLQQECNELTQTTVEIDKNSELGRMVLAEK
jgi:predicted GTPase